MDNRLCRLVRRSEYQRWKVRARLRKEGSRNAAQADSL